MNHSERRGIERRAQIVKLLKQRPGLRISEIAKAVGAHVDGVGKHCRKLLATGEIVRHRGGPLTIYGPKGYVAPDHVTDAQRRSIQKRLNAPRAVEWFEEQPVQRLVSANDAPSLYVRGPASVWQWGAA